MTRFAHAPIHMFTEKGTYMVTGATYNKEHFFKSSEALTLLHDSLLNIAQEFGWNLQAWAVFSNHYHFVAHCAQNPETLPKLIGKLHRNTATTINKLDNQSGRKVWYQYWDTCITFHASYLARLKYVQENPVKHGIVTHASLYTWCSASWFENNADPAFRLIIDNIKYDKVNVADAFFDTPILG